MKRGVLKNGITLLYEQKDTKSASIQVMVKVGSNDETPGEKGIAHMCEHLVFEGTKKRENAQIISSEIENLGGEFNAYTTNWRTSYFIKILGKHMPKAINILADILANSIFREKDFHREREVVLKEIDMMHDDPKSHAWLSLEKKLFAKNNCRFPSYGDPKDLKNMTRDQVYEFYKKQYIAQNLIIAISGNVPNCKELVTKAFKDFPTGTPMKRKLVKEAPIKRAKSIKEKRNYASTYLLSGFRGPHKSHKDSFTLDIIAAILGKGQSGKLFHEIRGKRGLAYDVGVEFNADKDFGYFVIFASASKKNISKVQTLIKAELKKLLDAKETTKEDLKAAITFLEGDSQMDLDDPQKVTDQMLFWEDISKATDMKQYIKHIRKVTLNDIKRVAKKYLQPNNAATIVLEGK